MTKKTERLIEICKLIKPLEGRILIQPLKLKTYMEEQIVNTGMPYQEENEAYTGEIPAMDPIDEEVQTETKEVEVNKRFQEAIVLKLPENETRFKIGDTIIYMIGALYEFDFIKGVSILHKYDPVAIIE